MKSVMISIQPKWVEKICSGQKTIELRKNKPNLATPFKCYIYCTKSDRKGIPLLVGGGTVGFGDYRNAYTCDVNGKVDCYIAEGKVIGEFVCDKIYDIKPYFDRPDFLTQYICGWKYGKDCACLSFSEMNSYLKENDGYGWHISDLKIYDKPRGLSEFKKPCDRFLDCITCKRLVRNEFLSCDNKITRPPQSWCYVESLGE